jgi:hypothetical protein
MAPANDALGSSAHCQTTREYPIQSCADYQKKGDLVALNFLERLVAEWYEFRGYFVRRKINVGPSLKGKFGFELDIVAFGLLPENWSVWR